MSVPSQKVRARVGVQPPLFDVRRFVAVVPTSEPDLRRLNHLLSTPDEAPRIAVLGKYNHGKSTLLNALVGTDHFKVADKRETVTISEYEHNGVVWVDTPGLDADPTEIDDRQAQKVAFEIADFLFLVHQVQAGELDRYEINAFMGLAKQDKNYRKKMALVLTQTDQRDPTEVSAVEKRCRAQLQDNLDLCEIATMAVSADRYQDPKRRGLGGMKDVFAQVERLKSDTATLRCREWSRLTGGVLNELRDKQKETQSELGEARHGLHDIQRRLESAATTLVGKIRQGVV